MADLKFYSSKIPNLSIIVPADNQFIFDCYREMKMDAEKLDEIYNCMRGKIEGMVEDAKRTQRFVGGQAFITHWVIRARQVIYIRWTWKVDDGRLVIEPDEKIRFIPDNFKTKTQLLRMGLKPKGEVVGYLRLRGGAGGPKDCPLYDVEFKEKKTKRET